MLTLVRRAALARHCSNSMIVLMSMLQLGNRTLAFAQSLRHAVFQVSSPCRRMFLHDTTYERALTRSQPQLLQDPGRQRGHGRAKERHIYQRHPQERGSIPQHQARRYHGGG